MTDPAQERPAVTPEVTTAPAGSGWSRIPDHLGRARTSTVVLGVLFLAIGTLYLNIRPDTTSTATTGTSTEAPVQTTEPVPTTTATTTPEPTQESQPTSTEQTPTSSSPPVTTAPEETATSTVPLPSSTSTSTLPIPTTAAPSG
jgi:hypothetical protein